MDGWRLWCVAAPRELMSALVRVHQRWSASISQYTTVCATSFAQAGAAAACTGLRECVSEKVEEFDRRRKLIVEALNAMAEVYCADPHGAFYVFPSVASFGLSSAELAMRLLREAKVAVPGSAFSEPGEGESPDGVLDQLQRFRGRHGRDAGVR
jgi:aminotransferase